MRRQAAQKPSGWTVFQNSVLRGVWHALKRQDCDAIDAAPDFNHVAARARTALGDSCPCVAPTPPPSIPLAGCLHLRCKLELHSLRVASIAQQRASLASECGFHVASCYSPLDHNAFIEIHEPSSRQGRSTPLHPPHFLPSWCKSPCPAELGPPELCPMPGVAGEVAAPSNSRAKLCSSGSYWSPCCGVQPLTTERVL